MVKELHTEPDFSIRLLRPADVISAMELVWSVFSEFDAPDYSDEGIAEFQNFIAIDSVKERMGSSELLLWGY